MIDNSSCELLLSCDDLSLDVACHAIFNPLVIGNKLIFEVVRDRERIRNGKKI